MPHPDPLTAVHAYHRRSKHQFERYAANPGFMDWSTQPDPFRRYAGAEQIPLPLTADNESALYTELFPPNRLPSRPASLASVALLLELSFGLSNWKAYGGDRWALRCNPSSGNLHPTEAYMVVGSGVDGLAPGVYHYQSHDHVLERRCRADLPFAGLMVGLSSIHWREAWKYGERAFRYCQHDVGHALAALRYSAGMPGWRVKLLEEWGDDDIAVLLGLDRDADFADAEAEAPDLLCRIVPPESPEELSEIEPIIAAVRAGEWFGRANTLSGIHRHHWQAIDDVHQASFKPRTVNRMNDSDERHAAPGPISLREKAEVRSILPDLPPSLVDYRAAALIRQRRSAQAFDGITALPARALFRILDATLPRMDCAPFDAWPYPPQVHLLLFVHRVEGLPPGLYLLARRAAAQAELRQAMRGAFEWTAAEGCPAHVPLFRLVRANTQKAAIRLSCHQEIAGTSAVSLGMLAEFDTALEQGPWMYRRLFWECGVVGQSLYLEAEAAGVRGTGIGCFFDDPVHETLGLTGSRYQSLYHFTVGGPVVDVRLQTLPPYGHLGER